MEYRVVEGRSMGTVRSKVLDMGWHVVGCRPGCEMAMSGEEETKRWGQC